MKHYFLLFFFVFSLSPTISDATTTSDRKIMFSILSLLLPNDSDHQDCSVDLSTCTSEVSCQNADGFWDSLELACKAKYTDMGNGIVLDNKYQVLWQQSDDGTIRNYNDATQYCTDLVIDGIDNWVLPSKSDLLTLIDLNFSPTIDPIFIARPFEYLTSESSLGMCSLYGGGLAVGSYTEIINFSNGSVSFEPISSLCNIDAAAGYVRCKSEYISAD